MLQARFGLGCHSGFPTAAQKTPLPKTAPAPTRAMPLEREPVSSVLLKRGIKRTNPIRDWKGYFCPPPRLVDRTGAGAAAGGAELGGGQGVQPPPWLQGGR